MEIISELSYLAFLFTVWIYLTIVTIRCVIVGLYNCYSSFIGIQDLNPLRVEEVHYESFFKLSWAWFEVLCLHWKIWGPEAMLFKVADIVKSGH